MFVAIVSSFSNIKWVNPTTPVIDFKTDSISVLTKKFVLWAYANKIQVALVDPSLDISFMMWYQNGGKNVCPVYAAKKDGIDKVLLNLEPNLVLNFDKTFGSYDQKVVNIRVTDSLNFTNTFFNSLFLSIANNVFLNKAPPNGISFSTPIDTDSFYPFHYGQKAALRSRIKDLPNDAIIFGVSSRHINYLVLFNVWKQLEKTHPNVYLLCLNSMDVHGNQFSEITKSLKNVVFYPPVTSNIEINEFYNTIDFFLQPNTSHTTQSILEAMSVNVPVVTLKSLEYLLKDKAVYIPITDVLTEKDCFVPVSTSSAIVETIIECVKNKTTFKNYNGREFALQFDQNVVFPKWKAEFDNLTRRFTPIRNQKIAVICPSLGQVCGIGDYTLRLGSELKKLTDTFLYRQYDDSIIEKLVQTKVGTVFIQFEYALFPLEILRHFLLRLKQNNITSVIVMHSFIPVHTQYTPVFSLADYLFVHNPQLFEAWREKHGHDKVNLISMGIDSDTNQYNEKSVIRKRLGISDDAIVLSGFGFFEMHKDFNATARVVKNLMNRGHQNVYLLLASFSKGNQFSNMAESQFYQTLTQLGLEKNFIRVGQREYLSREEIRKYLSCSDVIVFSYPELFTNSSSASIRDAMPAGVPIVATDVSFFSEIDCIPKAKSEEELTALCEKIITDNEFKEKILLDTREFCKKNTWENLAQQYVSFVKNHND